MNSLGLLVYGDTSRFTDRIAKWADDMKPSRLVVVNNHAGMLAAGEMAGDNTHFEFSGYRVLCANLSGDGPFVIVNDTLFRNHWTGGWTQLLRIVMRRIDCTQDVVYGDIRRDGNSIPERPDPFLASWIFVLPNRAVLLRFDQILDQLCRTDLPEPSPAYAAFLKNWTAAGKRFRGWHGKRDPASVDRKIRAVRFEHALSEALPDAGLPIVSLGTFSPVLYRTIRVVDRLQTRISALLPF